MWWLSEALLHLIHLGTIIVCRIGPHEWHDSKLGEQTCNLFEVDILPCEWNSALAECNHHEVDEGLLVKRVHGTLAAGVVSHLCVELSQLRDCKSWRFCAVKRDMNILKVQGGLSTAKVLSLDPVHERQVLKCGLILLDSNLLTFDCLLQDTQNLLRNAVLLSNGFDNPIIELSIHLTGIIINFLKNSKCPRVNQG